jgi:cytochrome c biogenesis protein CcdA
MRANLIPAVQKALVTAALFLLYVFGFGLTLLAVKLFSRRLLSGPAEDAPSFWLEAEGYEPDRADCLRES